jgi:hypothetical protein
LEHVLTSYTQFQNWLDQKFGTVRARIDTHIANSQSLLQIWKHDIYVKYKSLDAAYQPVMKQIVHEYKYLYTKTYTKFNHHVAHATQTVSSIIPKEHLEIYILSAALLFILSMVFTVRRIHYRKSLQTRQAILVLESVREILTRLQSRFESGDESAVWAEQIKDIVLPLHGQWESRESMGGEIVDAMEGFCEVEREEMWRLVREGVVKSGHVVEFCMDDGLLWAWAAETEQE